MKAQHPGCTKELSESPCAGAPASASALPRALPSVNQKALGRGLRKPQAGVSRGNLRKIGCNLWERDIRHSAIIISTAISIHFLPRRPAERLNVRSRPQPAPARAWSHQNHQTLLVADGFFKTKATAVAQQPTRRLYLPKDLCTNSHHGFIHEIPTLSAGKG